VELMRYGDVINTIDQALTVYSREFPIQRLNVSSDLQAKRDESLWEQDRKYTTAAREKPNSVPLWEGAFLQPVEGRISTEFGLTRYINGVDSGRHSGLDIAAPTGTPLMASNSGVVTLARMLHVTGNTVIIDHGLNLFTSYSHLHQIEVEPNQQVKKGERIGTVGNTGFSTGPHLHWSVVIGGEFVDPALVTKDDPKNLFPD